MFRTVRTLALLCTWGVLLAAPSLLAAPAERTFAIHERGLQTLWAVALDEIYLEGPGSFGLEKLPAKPDFAGILAHVEQLNAAGRSARLVLYPRGSERAEFNRRFVTDDLLVQFAPGANPSAAVRFVGAREARPVKLLPNTFLFRVSGPGQALLAAEQLRSLPEVLAAEPQLARQADKKLLPNDPFFSRQWHLQNTGQNSGTVGLDVRVTNVWDRYRGAGVVIGIVDDGLARTHPDLAPNYSAALSRDFNDGDADPSPNVATDFHGTAVAGLVAARGDNAVGVVGVAYEATLAGLRLVARPATDELEAEGILHSNDVIQVKNNSWGAPDCPAFGSVLERAGPLLQAALAEGTATGRQGRGTIYVWAAGNGAGCFEDINYDGYANSIYVLPIGAVTDQGLHAPYSESSACLVGCVPSGSPGRQGLTTTDLVGNDGFNRPGASGELSDRNYTQLFAGTSAAAPVASGLVALLLQARPELNWRDVKEILLRSSTRLQPADVIWRTNSAGIAHHYQFGGGLLNAEKAVQLATHWPGLGPPQQWSAAAAGLPLGIPDEDPSGVTRTLLVTNAGFRVEHITLTLTTHHPNWGDLAVSVVSPSGMESRLAWLHPGNPTYDYRGWTFSSVRHWGENAQGTWTVRVTDEAAEDVGTLDALELTLYGSSPKARLDVAFTPQAVELRLRTPNVGGRYAVESSDDLQVWERLGVTTIGENGEATMTAPAAGPSALTRFYRAQWVR